MNNPCPPFSDCWCELRPNHPKCKPKLNAESDLLCFTLVVLMILSMFKILKRQKTLNE